MRYLMVIGAALREVISAKGGPVSNDGLTPGFGRFGGMFSTWVTPRGRGYLGVTQKSVSAFPYVLSCPAFGDRFRNLRPTR